MNKALVSVIIPCYNKAETVKRAIDSVAAQSYKHLELIVVDDGSTDESRTVIEQAIRDIGKPNYSYLFTVNEGVAHARNNGILVSQGDLVCCLDADDWLEPTFIEKCVAPLVADRGIGIAYTRLRAHLPDGTSQVSQWPGEFDTERQFNPKRRQNQIPTCCVFRREGFERVGGYRQRYAPQGAGSEDAAFWTAMLATGYTAKLVSNEALFNYSAFGGNVSGNRAYQERDWLAWYPHTRTKEHPFLCPIKPKNIAHVVRDYSEPVISVVVPVGEGHIEYVQDCIDSLEAQEFWQWELIVVDDSKAQALESLWFMTAYPFAKVYKTGGEKGAGAARNLGASQAKGDFLLFLDADDMLNVAHPQALGEMLAAYQQTGQGIYTAYIGRSYVEDIAQLAPDLQKNIVARDDDKETWIYHPVYDFNCADALKQPQQDQAGKVYVWCNISTLIPRQWHIAVGGFDESMETWEDIDYWWRLAKQGKCFTKLDEPYLIYRFYTSTRREKAHKKDKSGSPKWVTVLEYLKKKHSQVKIMGCNCGKKQQIVKLPSNIISSQESELKMVDEFVMIEFHFPGEERGSYGKKLNSPTGKLGPNGRILEYGGYSRRAGDKFLVHQDDQKARPDLFVLIKEQAPPIQEEPLAEPELIAPPVPVSIKENLTSLQNPEREEKAGDAQVASDEAENSEDSFFLDTLNLTVKQKQSLIEAKAVVTEAIKDLGLEGLIALPGFGKVSASKLLDELQ